MLGQQTAQCSDQQDRFTEWQVVGVNDAGGIRRVTAPDDFPLSFLKISLLCRLLGGKNGRPLLVPAPQFLLTRPAHPVG